MKKPLGIFVALIAGVACAHSADAPHPAFAFKYGERTVTGGESMQVDARLKEADESRTPISCQNRR